jgi:imidazolonepropionase-like amidohydrolase
LRFRGSFLLLALAATGAFAQSKDIAVTGARIEIGDGKVIPVGAVLIHDGKIAAVGDNVTVPPGADVIDAKGKTLYPGFIDAYSTRGIKLPDAPAAGTPPDSRTAANATMWHGNRKGIRSDIVAAKCLDIKDQLTANYEQGITTALLTPGTGTIRGIASIVTYTDAGDILVPAAAGEIAVRGGGFGGGGGGAALPNGDTGYPGSLLGIIAVARQYLIDAGQYAADSSAKKDDGMDNLKPLMAKQIPALLSADTEREIVRCGRLADEFGFKSLYGGAHDAYIVADMLKAKNSAVLAAVEAGAEPPVKATEGIPNDSTPEEVLVERHATWVERSQNIKKLIDAGIPVAFSSFGGNLPDFLKNVRKVIATGVSRDTALKCMTSGSATILGIADRVGTIEMGKQANLVLMSGDFADDKSEVQSVFVEGKKIDIKKGAGK